MHILQRVGDKIHEDSRACSVSEVSRRPAICEMLQQPLQIRNTLWNSTPSPLRRKHKLPWVLKDNILHIYCNPFVRLQIRLPTWSEVFNRTGIYSKT